MKNFSALMQLRNRKFEKYRDGKMKLIRERLAILRIKKYWKKKKLSVRVIRQKIRRFKRKRLSTLSSRPRRQTVRNKAQDITTHNFSLRSCSPSMDEIPLSVIISKKESPDFESLRDSSHTLVIETNTSNKELIEEDAKTDEELRPSSEASSNVEEKEQMRKLFLIEQERKRRIEFGYKSYCINKHKVKRVFPLLSEQSMSPDASFMDYSTLTPSPDRLWYNDSPIKTTLISNDDSSNKLPNFKKLKYTKKPLQSQDSEESEEPSYMKATESSNRARWDNSIFVAINEDEAPSRVLKKYTGHNFLMHPTISYKMKVQHIPPRANSEDPKIKKPWRPNTIYSTPYISSAASPSRSAMTQLYSKPMNTSYLPSTNKREAECTSFGNISHNNLRSITQPTEITQLLETKSNVVTLSFQDALPEISGLLEKYQVYLPSLRPKKPLEIIPLTRNLRFRKYLN